MSTRRCKASAETIGLVGVGLMGTALAERLIAGGFRVVGFDRSRARMRALAKFGGQAAADAAPVFSGCRRVLLSLPDSNVVRDVLGAVKNRLQRGQIIVDTTTGSPLDAEEAGRRLAKLGVDYLDATISGNSEQTRKGDVVAMVGGPAGTFDACQDLFRLLTRRSFHVGSWGCGARMKLATNLVLGLNRAVLAEGLAFASALGLDPAQTLAVLRESAAYSRVMDVKGRKMLARDFKPQARLSQHLKDVRLILKSGASAKAKLPLSRVHEHLLAAAAAAGLGGRDNCAIIEMFKVKKK